MQWETTRKPDREKGKKKGEKIFQPVRNHSNHQKPNGRREEREEIEELASFSPFKEMGTLSGPNVTVNSVCGLENTFISEGSETQIFRF